jgi:hypothetical protein
MSVRLGFADVTEGIVEHVAHSIGRHVGESSTDLHGCQMEQMPLDCILDKLREHTPFCAHEHQDASATPNRFVWTK